MRHPVDPPALVRRDEDELKKLAAAINADHKAGDKAEKDEADTRLHKLRTRQSCGANLLKAKAACGHGRWLPFVKEHLAVAERHARVYMAFAKSAVATAVMKSAVATADLDAAEAEWRRLCGNPPAEDAEAITVDAWQEMTQEERDHALSASLSGGKRFNDQQDNEGIQWALWSWNPVTGCLHECPYCYARDIANRFYETKFAPALWPSRLGAPVNTPFPADRIASETNPVRKMGLGNVFTCSMADLFGRWVPKEWIDLVLAAAAGAPRWNFLFLTKFPQRMAEFEFPENAWVGTTVDCQARVANAERAFRKIEAKVKWLSCEPLIEPLTFTDLAAFDWLVLGGSSASTQTPEWKPPRSWVNAIEDAAASAGVMVYEKPNLLYNRQSYPGMEMIEPDAAPEQLRYLPEVK